MNDKLVRSGAPHSVTFNEVTHNALSPKNDLTEGEKKEINTNSGLPVPDGNGHEHPNSVALDSQENSIVSNGEAFASDKTKNQDISNIKKSPIKTHFKKIQSQLPLTDSQFREAIQRLEDRVHHFKESYPAENMQKIGNDVFNDNLQMVDDSKRFEKHLVYVGKQNIKDRSVIIDSPSDHVLQPSDDEKENSMHSTGTTESPLISKLIPTNEQVDSQANKSHLEELAPVIEDDHLQVQIKIMKQKLRHANQKLIDIQVNERKEME
jgi:hypothetical protein